MGIFGFLFGLGCLVVIAWAIALVTNAVLGRKRRQQNRPQQPPSLAPPRNSRALWLAAASSMRFLPLDNLIEVTNMLRVNITAITLCLD